MDLVSGLPHTGRGDDSIWVIIDRLTKFAHFLPFKTGELMDKMTTLNTNEIVKLDVVNVSIISEQDDTRFVSRF